MFSSTPLEARSRQTDGGGKSSTFSWGGFDTPARRRYGFETERVLLHALFRPQPLSTGAAGFFFRAVRWRPTPRERSIAYGYQRIWRCADGLNCKRNDMTANRSQSVLQVARIIAGLRSASQTLRRRFVSSTTRTRTRGRPSSLSSQTLRRRFVSSTKAVGRTRGSAAQLSNLAKKVRFFDAAVGAKRNAALGSQTLRRRFVSSTEKVRVVAWRIVALSNLAKKVRFFDESLNRGSIPRAGTGLSNLAKKVRFFDTPRKSDVAPATKLSNLAKKVRFFDLCVLVDTALSGITSQTLRRRFVSSTFRG